MDDVFLPYLEQVQKAVETGWFDAIGHLDLPKRYAPKTHRDYDPARYRERLLPIFDAMIERGVGFEINTSGLRQTPKTSMPGPAIVRWYADRGGSLDHHRNRFARGANGGSRTGEDAAHARALWHRRRGLLPRPDGDARADRHVAAEGELRRANQDAPGPREGAPEQQGAPRVWRARPEMRRAERRDAAMSARSARLAVDQAAGRAAPLFLTSILSLAGALDALRLPTGAAPVRIGLVVLALVIGIGITVAHGPARSATLLADDAAGHAHPACRSSRSRRRRRAFRSWRSRAVRPGRSSG